MSGHPEELGLTDDGMDVPQHVTQEDLANETKTVMHYVAQQAETIRDQLYHLHQTHTVALMAAQLYSHHATASFEDSAQQAKKLYRETQKTLEIDRAIVGQIPA